MVCSVIAKGTDRILACIGTSVRTALEGEKRKGRTQFNKRQRIPPCVPLYAPVWRFLSKMEELPYVGRKSAEKRDLEYHKM